MISWKKVTESDTFQNANVNERETIRDNWVKKTLERVPEDKRKEIGKKLTDVTDMHLKQLTLKHLYETEKWKGKPLTEKEGDKWETHGGVYDPIDLTIDVALGLTTGPVGVLGKRAIQKGAKEGGKMLAKNIGLELLTGAGAGAGMYGAEEITGKSIPSMLGGGLLGATATTLVRRSGAKAIRRAFSRDGEDKARQVAEGLTGSKEAAKDAVEKIKTTKRADRGIGERAELPRLKEGGPEVVLSKSPIQGERYRAMLPDEDLFTTIRKVKAGEVVDEKNLHQATNAMAKDPMGNQMDLTKLHSIGPSTADLGDEIAIATKDPTLRGLFKDLKTKDLNWFHRIWNLPHWIAKRWEKFEPIYKRQIDRTAEAINLRHAFLKGSKAKGIAGVEDFLTMKGKEFRRVHELLVRGDRLKEVFNPEDLAKAGYTKREIKAYQDVRATFDWVWKDAIARMRKSGVPDNEIKKLRNEIGKLVGYIPHGRDGKYWVSAVDHEGNHVWNTSVSSLRQLKKVERWLGQKYPKMQIQHGRTTVVPEEAYFRVTADAINAIMKRTKAKADIDDLTMQAIYDGIAETFKERGFMKHAILRKGVPGFVGDLDGPDIGQFRPEAMKDAFVKYLSGYAGFVNKMDASRDMTAALREIDPTSTLWKYANNYIEDVLRAGDKLDNFVAKGRSLFFMKYLGFNVKSAILNLTQNLIAAGPVMAARGIKFPEIKIAKAMKDIRFHMNPEKSTRKNLTDVEVEALQEALMKGHNRAQYLEELMATNEHLMGRGQKRVMDWAGKLFSISEMANRQATFLASFRHFYNGKNYDDAVAKAVDVVHDSHYVYGKTNTPEWGRGKSPFSKLARLPATFRSYTLNYLQMLGHLTRTNKAAAARSLGWLMLLGGAGSMPFFGAVNWAYRKWTGGDLRTELKQYTRGLTDSEIMANIALYGAPAIGGVTMQGSFEIGVPLTAQDFLGVVYQVGPDAKNTYDFIKSGQALRALESTPLTPQMARNMLSAYRYYRYGQTTKLGNQVAMLDPATGKAIPVKLNEIEAIEKAIGFQPVKLSDGWRRYEATKGRQEFYSKQKQNLKARWLEAKRDKNERKAAQIVRKIQKFNKTLPLDVPPIDGGYLLEGLMIKPSGREWLRMKEVQ